MNEEISLLMLRLNESNNSEYKIKVHRKISVLETSLCSVEEGCFSEVENEESEDE
jgi:hypothetical protein